MSDVIWWLDATKNTTSGGLLRYARSDGDLQFYAGNNSYYWIGFKCVKEANAIESALGNDKYEAYSYHSFIKFDITSVTTEVNSAVIYLRLYTNPEGDSTRCNVDPSPTNAYLDVWYKKTNDGGFPWSTLSTSDYGWPSWEYLSSSSKNAWEIVGQSAVGGGWLAEIDVTAAVNYSISQGWSSVAFRFNLGKFGIPWLAPDDWTYKTRPTSYDQECWFILCGACYLLIGDPPPTYEATTSKSSSSGCPWLKVAIPSGEIPEQWEPGEDSGPTRVNCIDADTEAQMAVAGTDGGGLWATWSGGFWYKIYEHDLPITAAYMDYIRNFVNYPDSQITWFGTVSGEIFKSTESMYSWRNVVTFSGDVHDIEGSDLDSNKVAVCVGESVYTTKDGGESWVMSKDLGSLGKNLMVRGDEIQVIAEDGKGYRSPNFGSTWYNFTGITTTAADVGFSNINEQDSFVGVSGYLYVQDTGTTNFSYTAGATISGAVNQIDVSHRTSVAVVATTDKIYKTINFGNNVYELLDSPAQAVALGGLVPIEYTPMPSNKPPNVFAPILSSGSYGYSHPQKTYIFRSINGDLYAIVDCVHLRRSIDNGLTWSQAFVYTPSDEWPSLPPSTGMRVYPTYPNEGGVNMCVDNNGDVHILYGVWWRNRMYTTGTYLVYTTSQIRLKHAVIRGDELISNEILYDYTENKTNYYTDINVLCCAVNSKNEYVVVWKSRDDAIPHEITMQNGKCYTCGWYYSYRSGEPENGIETYTSLPEAYPSRKCPVCGGTISTRYPVSPWPAVRGYRGGDRLYCTGDALNGMSVQLWSHGYYPPLVYPNRKSNNHITNNTITMVIDGNDTIHWTYYDPFLGKTVYTNKPYVGDDGMTGMLSDDVYLSVSGKAEAMVDQYNNIHYMFGSSYIIRFSDGTWSSIETVPYSIGSFSRSWDGKIWHMRSLIRPGGVSPPTGWRIIDLRTPLAAPIVGIDITRREFVISIDSEHPFHDLTSDHKVQVINSADNNGAYSVVSTSYDSDISRLTIAVAEQIPSDSVAGEVITINLLSSTGLTFGTWSIYSQRGYYPGGVAGMIHSYYPVDVHGVHSCIFETGFAGMISQKAITSSYIYNIYYWSDPPETKLLGEGNGDN